MIAAKNTDPDLLPCPFCGSGTYFCFGRDDEIVNVRCERWGSGCLGAGSNESSIDAAAAAWNTRAASVKAGEVVAVRPLEWHENLKQGDRVGFVCSEGGVLSYSIMLSKFRVYGVAGDHDGAAEFGSLEAAKAAAQADYERRITSALIVEPVPPDTTASVVAMREALGDCRTHYDAWRSAIEAARDNAPDEADESYWRHELKAFERTFAAIAAANQSDVEALAATTAERTGTVTSEPEPSTSDTPPAPQAVEAVSVEEVAQCIYYADPFPDLGGPLNWSHLNSSVKEKHRKQARALLAKFKMEGR